MNGPVLAIDIGEDRIAVGVTDDAGHVTHRKEVPSLPGTDPDAVFDALAALALSVLTGTDPAALRAVGVAVSGPRPSSDGRVSPSALPSWVDYPLVSRLQDKHPSVPVHVHSQGDCFAVAERVAGAARGSARVLGVLLNGNVDGGLLLRPAPGPGCRPARARRRRSGGAGVRVRGHRLPRRRRPGRGRRRLGARARLGRRRYCRAGRAGGFGTGR